MTKCKYCNKEITSSSRRYYCSTLCYISYLNKKPTIQKDKMGRPYYSCSVCKHRMKKIDHLGKTKLICNTCRKKKDHVKGEFSQFMKTKLIKDKKVTEVVLEITQHNRNWHYIDCHPVLGLKKAINYYKIKIFNMTNRGYKIKKDSQSI